MSQLQRCRGGSLPVACGFVLALAAVAGPARAGVDVWTPIGPYGGSITVLAASPVQPSLVYAGSFGGGVYRSEDGGATWAPASRGIDPYVLQVVADPASPSTVYEVSLTSAMRSVDGGTTWRRLGAPGLVLRNTFLSLAIDPRTPSTLYGGAGGGLWKSLDAGASWTLLTLKYGDVTQIAVVAPSATSRVVYAVADGSVPLRSTDSGKSWSEANAGIPSALGSELQLAVDPSRPANVYVSYLDESNVGHFQRSTDRGESWSETPNPAGYPLAVASGVIYAGSAVSADGGATWTVASAAPGVSHVYAAGSGPARTVYAGTTQGVWISDDAETTWQPASQGLAATQIAALAVDPVHPRILYAAALDPDTGALRLMKSGSSGQSWHPIGPPSIAQDLATLVIDPLTSTTLYAGSIDGLAKSTDGGSTWEQLTISASFCNQVNQLAIDPSHPDTLYASAALYGCPTFKSTDGGASWGPLPVPAKVVAQVFVAPSATSTLYAMNSGAVFQSADAGSTWRPLHIPNVQPVSLAIDPTDASHVFMATTTAIFGTTDGGATWAELSRGLPLNQLSDITPPTALAIDPHLPDVVYTGGAWGIYRSADGGATWHPITGGLPSFAAVFTRAGYFLGGILAVDPRQPGKLYAGTRFDGIYTYTVE